VPTVAANRLAPTAAAPAVVTVKAERSTADGPADLQPIELRCPAAERVPDGRKRVGHVRSLPLPWKGCD
jgi:hypothetical protein